MERRQCVWGGVVIQTVERHTPSGLVITPNTGASCSVHSPFNPYPRLSSTLLADTKAIRLICTRDFLGAIHALPCFICVR